MKFQPRSLHDDDDDDDPSYRFFEIICKEGVSAAEKKKNSYSYLKMGKGIGTGDGVGRGSGQYKGKSDRIAVPAMPLPMALICCVLNFLIPGFGTAIAGLSAFCCSRNEDMDGLDRLFSCGVNVGIGCLQALSALLCLVGWVWSCVWGYYFIFSSSEYYKGNNPEDIDGAPEAVIVSQGGQTGIVLSQPSAMSVIVNQGYSQTGTQVYMQQPGNPYPVNPCPPPYPGTEASTFNNVVHPTK